MNAMMLIDFLNDFVLNGAPLQVKQAQADAFRASRFLSKNVKKIDALFIPQDYHPTFHISHGCFWMVNGDKNVHPNPFDLIKLEDVLSGKYQPVNKEDFDHANNYVRGVEELGGVHIIWPVHCVAGTPGSNLYSLVADTVRDWELARNLAANFVMKGMDYRWEMHSPFSVAHRPTEYHCPNNEVLNKLTGYKKIFVTGEAYSHCVKKTVDDMLAWGIRPQQIVMLEDCMNAIDGFDMTAWKAEKMALGVVFTNSVEGI